ncbi:MAG: 1-acyl-sn-glycerol-3-phosphate acyltransferase [Spirochaetes bacterium]|nr:1-acyl-sn-glycerol-3-phosphate acyltransferase [Spirochaetota bacterium]
MKSFFIYIQSIVLWFFWWSSAFIFGNFIFFVSFIIPKRFHDLLVKVLCSILTYSVFIIPKHKGLKPSKIPFPVIFVPNHVSFFDLFICGCSLPGNPRGIELQKFFHLPVYGWFITRFNMIPIDPGKKVSVLKAMNTAAKKLINNERNILIMPEGMRTLTGKPGEFKNGAFYLSRKYNIPIVPVVFKKLFEINNRKSIIIRPGICEIYLMDAVYPQRFKSDIDLNKYVKNIIEKKYDE